MVEHDADFGGGQMPEASTYGSGSAGRRLARRRLLGVGTVLAGGAGAALLVPRLTARPVAPSDPVVARVEAERSRTGVTVTRTLRAASLTAEIGGRRVVTWGYDAQVSRSPLRVRVGDELRVRLVNDLPVATTVHWHGLRLRNDMDGVPGVTMPVVPSGGRFDYAFVVPHPGTYWFHPHAGVQLDTGLYGPLIVDDAAEPGGYDDEVILALDDWTDGWAATPDAILARTRRDGMGAMSGMGGMGGMASPAQPLGADTGDVAYPVHLVNGGAPTDPIIVTSRPGQRLRLRLINAAADTAYRFAVGGHRLTVTHTDGYPVQPVEVDTLIVGMGERYDLLVTVADGTFPIVAVPEGKHDAPALAVLRSAAGPLPAPNSRPVELAGRLLNYRQLVVAGSERLDGRRPDRTVRAQLTMADGGRQWLINGRAYPDHQPLKVSAGERVRLVLDNRTMMFHPMHLHGHAFSLARPDATGPLKDTVNVLPMEELAVDLEADNPGQWLMHCHNAYHGELGMMTVLSYQT